MTLVAGLQTKSRNIFMEAALRLPDVTQSVILPIIAPLLNTEIMFSKQMLVRIFSSLETQNVTMRNNERTMQRLRAELDYERQERYWEGENFRREMQQLNKKIDSLVRQSKTEKNIAEETITMLEEKLCSAEANNILLKAR